IIWMLSSWRATNFPPATQVNEEINVASSDSEVEIVGVQEHARNEVCAAAGGQRIPGIGRSEVKAEKTNELPKGKASSKSEELCEHRYVHPRGGVIQTVSSRKHGSGLQCPRQSETWTWSPLKW
ncbi:hypothetical protein E2320_017858, partial [Naja naja]